jgi:hypothetical protein
MDNIMFITDAKKPGLNRDGKEVKKIKFDYN